MGRLQYALLEHLAAVAVMQKAVARSQHTRFRGGWTYVRTTDKVRITTIRSLIKRGYVAACCTATNGSDLIRITKEGVAELEKKLGRVILA